MSAICLYLPLLLHFSRTEVRRCTMDLCVSHNDWQLQEKPFGSEEHSISNCLCGQYVHKSSYVRMYFSYLQCIFNRVTLE